MMTHRLFRLAESRHGATPRAAGSDKAAHRSPAACGFGHKKGWQGRREPRTGRGLMHQSPAGERPALNFS